ncbi:flagellin N-terminal helical domain-containing protein [Magnetococcus sp. PR-3]|uniref:flagellin N-terminal helical domain-containing protein n=1 Tax=Magnetococcus sp. PR-3 TaxID=3120355 RepID=UPI002FCDFAC1
MALYINTNIASLNSQKMLTNSTNYLQDRFERLASGKKLNSAKDDASGLAITNRTTAQIRGMNQAARNANDGISFLQVSDGALEQTEDMLQRLREMAVQSANATYNSTDRADIQLAVAELTAEIQRIGAERKFNDQVMLDGTFANQNFQVGAFSSEVITVTIPSATASAVGVEDLSLSTQAKAEAALTTLDTAIDTIAQIRSDLGSTQNRFMSVIANLTSMSNNTSAMQAQITDTDVAAETASLTRGSVIQQAGTAMLAQANQMPQLALQLLG